MFAHDQGGLSRPRKLLSVLKAAKTHQDLSAQPNRGRGLWLNNKLWLTITKHLEQQALELDELQRDLAQKKQETELLRKQAGADREAQQRVIEALQTQAAQLQAAAASPLEELGSLQAQMHAKQEAWNAQRRDLETQVEGLMGLLRTMGLMDGSGAVADGTGAGDGTAAASGLQTQARAGRRQGQQAMPGFELTAPEAQAIRIRELSLLLSEARQRAESYRQQLAARSSPQEELRNDIKRLQADNRRLVALLAKVPEYRGFAAEVASEAGLHYLPLEECLMIRGQVEDLYPQMQDRQVEDVTGSDLAGTGRRRDPDGPDSSLTAVLDEEYHWAPRKALETGAALMRRLLPALPISQLVALVAELNKVWRDRERQRLADVAAAHQEELRKLQLTFQQRAPYEAVVAGRKINDLKRRIRAQAAQAEAAAAVARGEQRRQEDDSKVILQAGLSSIQDLSRQVTRLLARNKKLSSKVAKQRAKAAARAPVQPVCSACLDRLLQQNAVPVHIPALGLSGPPSELQLQQPHQQHQAVADVATVAARRFELPPAAAVVSAAVAPRQLRQQQQQQPRTEAAFEHQEAASQAGAHTNLSGFDLQDQQQRYPHDGYNLRGAAPPLQESGRTRELAASFDGGPRAGGAGSRPPPMPVPYGTSAPSVRANVVAPSALTRWPREGGEAQPGAAQSASTPGGPQAAAPLQVATAPPASLYSAGGLLALGNQHLEPVMTGFTITGPEPGLERQAAGGVGAAAPPAATAEFSAASLNDWHGRTSGGGGGWVPTAASGAAGDANVGPLTVKVDVGSGSPCRSVTVRSAAAGNGGGGVAATGGLDPQRQARGTPVTVCVRFPRHDTAIAPAAPQ